ncbi:MAG: RNA-binding S4 domain-containing protein [Cyanobacteria bacterium P01_H01_bin.15]
MPASVPPTDFIRLDQFLKAQQITSTGGQAKLLIQSGQILVNGEPETRRKRKLIHGDQVQYQTEILTVLFEPIEDTPESEI